MLTLCPFWNPQGAHSQNCKGIKPLNGIKAERISWVLFSKASFRLKNSKWVIQIADSVKDNIAKKQFNKVNPKKIYSADIKHKTSIEKPLWRSCEKIQNNKYKNIIDIKRIKWSSKIVQGMVA